MRGFVARECEGEGRNYDKPRRAAVVPIGGHEKTASVGFLRLRGGRSDRQAAVRSLVCSLCGALVLLKQAID